MTTSTRDQFIAKARALFAARGFYGASIASIAKELNLTKQALLHHFGSKEKLYGEVLQQISDELLLVTEEILSSDDEPAEQLVKVLLAQYRSYMAEQDAARLIMRELLDNEERAENAGSWYLKPYLDRLSETLRCVEGFQGMSRETALAVVYQFLGAVHYFAVSQPTLGNMFGKASFGGTQQHFEEQLVVMIRSRLER